MALFINDHTDIVVQSLLRFGLGEVARDFLAIGVRRPSRPDQDRQLGGLLEFQGLFIALLPLQSLSGGGFCQGKRQGCEKEEKSEKGIHGDLSD